MAVAAPTPRRVTDSAAARHDLECALGQRSLQGQRIAARCREPRFNEYELDLLQSARSPRCPPQSPAPGFGEKYWSLSDFPSHSLESGGGTFLAVIFGQIFAYSAFNRSHFSTPASVSGSIASTGHSGTQTPQSMHSSGWMTSMFSPS